MNEYDLASYLLTNKEEIRSHLASIVHSRLITSDQSDQFKDQYQKILLEELRNYLANTFNLNYGDLIVNINKQSVEKLLGADFFYFTGDTDNESD